MNCATKKREGQRLARSGRTSKTMDCLGRQEAPQMTPARRQSGVEGSGRIRLSRAAQSCVPGKIIDVALLKLPFVGGVGRPALSVNSLLRPLSQESRTGFHRPLTYGDAGRSSLLAKEPRHAYLQCFRERDCLIVHHVALSCLQFRKRFLVDAHPIARQPTGQILLRHKWSQLLPSQPDAWTDDILVLQLASLFHSPSFYQFP